MQKIASVAAFGLALGLSGCLVPPVELSGLKDPNAYRPVEQDLTPMALEKAMKKIDVQFKEPRSPASVGLSLETAEVSISRKNDYRGLWRAARAATWLAMNAGTLEAREAYSAKGVAIGRKAMEKDSTSVEPYYYTALCLAAYCQVKHERGYIPPTGLLQEAVRHGRMAHAIDATFDFSGPDRFLGQLICKTADTPKELADFETGLEHLKAAVERHPAYPENRLFLAEAYVDDDEPALARAELDRVFRSAPPADRSVEHGRWIKQATQLLGKTSAGGDEVDVTGFEDTRVVPTSASGDTAIGSP
ncbi:MAG: tetratricopeptide repeat protein [Planctomycetota bacterium]